MTADLAAFLLARVAEDEAVAREIIAEMVRVAPQYLPGSAPDPDDCGMYASEDLDHSPAVVVGPARVLAECGATRQIVVALDLTPCPCQRAQRCVIHDSSAGPPDFARERYADPVSDAVLHALALPYADDPQFREEWRP